MYLVMKETRGTAIYSLLNKEVRWWKTICMREWGRGRRKNVKERGEDKKKRWKEILSERGEGRAQHAWAALWDQLTNISATSAEANQLPSPERPVTVVMYRDPISPYIYSWILALLPVSGRETESEWMKERDRKVRLRACCWTVGEKVKEKEKEKDVDKKENET